MTVKTSSLPFFLLFSFSLLKPTKPDPDLLMDFCITNTASAHAVFFNGEACIDPAFALPTHFATSALSKPGDTAANLFGFNVTTTTTTNLPGANAQGLTLSRIDIAAAGIVPLHSHPRASEVVLLLHGTEVMVGFVDTSNKLHVQLLRPGDAFVFPRGLLHFLQNLDGTAPAVAVAGMNSQSPGVQVAAAAAFLSEPRMPEEVLEKSYRVSGQEIQRIQRNLGGG